jgi:integrase
MAAIYPHKKDGHEVFQVRFTLYLPDGSKKTKYRYRPTRSEATEVLRRAECLERGSRSCNLSPREVVQAQHDGLISHDEASLFSGVPRPPQRKRLSALIDRFNEVHHGQWRPRSKQKLGENFTKLLELLGDIYTDEINQDLLLDLFQKLACYPKWRNHAHLKQLSLEDCMNSLGYRSISTATFDGVWGSLGGLLTYGAENGEYGITRNFCGDKIFTLHRKLLEKSKNNGTDRLPYDTSDIQQLVLMLGTVDKKLNPHMLWIPLIALFNGMRQGEICQLFCDDIVTSGSIPCFRIQDCESRKQSVKNEQSRRTIPIHPTLLELGFLDFVTSRCRLGYERPWQNVKSQRVDYYEKQDTYAHYFEKWYNHTFRKYVILDPAARKRKPFHSLRHTFINWFFQNIRSQDRDNAAVKGLVGHLESDEHKMIAAVLKGISWDVYSQQLTPEPLLETLELLNYRIDVTPLALPVKW